ncbi:MAG TPA: D-alanine--D-alanine ligase [Nitrospirota bacterium]|jgi:D-alanine--D-alanine ligase
MIEQLKDKKIGVMMGGLSAEREVSMNSGRAVEAALREAGYDVRPIVFAGPDIIEEIKKSGPDVIFLALHGRYGEDGTIQGLLEILGIPYTGPGVLCSAIAMDKAVTKELLMQNGIPTADFVRLTPDIFDASKLVNTLGWPVVVKPASLGSTIGMSFVYEEKDLLPAVELAFRHDDTVLLERFIKGREVTVGIVGGTALPVVEIIPQGGVYDYEAKYQSTTTRYVCPAELTERTTKVIQDLAVDVFEALRGEGASRVDFRLDEDGKPWVLEMNTIPGMTGTSLLPKAAKAAGMGFAALIETVLLEALKRHEAKAKIQG